MAEALTRWESGLVEMQDLGYLAERLKHERQ